MRRWLLSTCSFVVAAVAALGPSRIARAQQDTDHAGNDAPASQSGTLTAPTLRTRVEATYPPDALRDKVEGKVGLEVVVDDTGSVVSAKVTGPAGHGFDEAALDAVRRFSFAPARQNGTPIRSTLQLSYEFHLPSPPPPPPRETMVSPPASPTPS